MRPVPRCAGRKEADFVLLFSNYVLMIFPSKYARLVIVRIAQLGILQVGERIITEF